MSALSLTAVGGLEGQGSVAFSTDLFVAVEFLGDGCNSGIHHTSSQSQHQVQGRLFLNVVVRQASAI